MAAHENFRERLILSQIKLGGTMTQGRDTTDKAIHWAMGEPHGRNAQGDIVEVPKKLSKNVEEVAPPMVAPLKDQPKGEDEVTVPEPTPQEETLNGVPGTLVEGADVDQPELEGNTDGGGVPTEGNDTNDVQPYRQDSDKDNDGKP